MTPPKATLTEMHEAVDNLAIRERASLDLLFARWPDMPQPKQERLVFVLESLARLLAVLATFEDRTRAFVGQLQEASRGG